MPMAVSSTIPEPLNTNETSPVVELHPTGDGSLLYRTLARVLVRNALKFASANPQNDGCESAKAAG